MKDNDTLPDGPRIPLEQVWDGLLNGDPGPFVALFDSLMDSDLPFAAGGLLRDLAERIANVSEEIDDDATQQQFIATSKQAILVCLQNDEAQLTALLQEATDE